MRVTLQPILIALNWSMEQGNEAALFKAYQYMFECRPLRSGL